MPSSQLVRQTFPRALQRQAMFRGRIQPITREHLARDLDTDPFPTRSSRSRVGMKGQSVNLSTSMDEIWNV